ETLARFPRGIGFRILANQLFERLPRGGVVAHVALRECDVEQRLGSLAALRPLEEQAPLRRDRCAVIAPRVLRVAEPVLRRRGERALRPGLDEAAEGGDRRLVLAALELVERAVVRALLGRGVRRAARRG